MEEMRERKGGDKRNGGRQEGKEDKREKKEEV